MLLYMQYQYHYNILTIKKVVSLKKRVKIIKQTLTTNKNNMQNKNNVSLTTTQDYCEKLYIKYKLNKLSDNFITRLVKRFYCNLFGIDYKEVNNIEL